MRQLFFAIMALSIFHSSSAKAMGLLQIYREALISDSIYASARASQLAGEEKAVQGRSSLMPNVVLSGQITRSSQESIGDFSSTGAALATSASNKTYGLQLSYTLQVTQPLFRWANWQQYEQGKLAVVASDAQFAQAKLDLIVRVAQAYFDVLDAQNVLTTLQAEKLSIAQQRIAAKRNFDIGTATITDSHEAQARYDLVVAQEYAAIADLNLKRAVLQQMSSKDIGELPMLKKGVTLAPLESAEEAYWLSLVDTKNYEVIAAQVRLEIAKRAISVSRAGHYPTVDLLATMQRTRASGDLPGSFPSADSNRTNSIGIQVSIPLFSGFMVSSQVNEAIALKEKARFDLESARRGAAQNARTALFGFNSGMEKVKALEVAVVSGAASLASNVRGYEVGVRINIDVLNAQHQLHQTRRELEKARYDAIMNGLRLKAIAASLRETDLIDVASLLAYGDE
ncbi:TolC family outer membrane protein [Undibacterium sp. Dicai25W]|uniref:TolC family outer membrane protein n=1 Tax=Undibacterium sp. Dicai25W TaxID=3413034 RepID=UPI003BF12E02